MQISVTCRHMEVTPALREHAISKAEHDFIEFPRIESVHIILDVQKYLHKAEVVIQASNHIRVEGHEESEDMYYSIDKAVEKASKQLRKLRDKVQDHKHSERLADIESAATGNQE